MLVPAVRSGMRMLQGMERASEDSSAGRQRRLRATGRTCDEMGFVWSGNGNLKANFRRVTASIDKPETSQGGEVQRQSLLAELATYCKPFGL
ncbi:MAG: hypothetical protein P8Y58_02925 [Novosphingobium sp.]